jgi:hypothetical protein
MKCKLLGISLASLIGFSLTAHSTQNEIWSRGTAGAPSLAPRLTSGFAAPSVNLSTYFGSIGDIVLDSTTSKFYGYNGSSWNQLSNDASVSASQMPALTGDVTSTAGTVATTVRKIQGTPVATTAPSADTQILMYNSAAAQYEPQLSFGKLIARFSADNQNSNIAATNFDIGTINPSVDTIYYLICYDEVTTRATTSSTLPSCALVCKDPITSTTVTRSVLGTATGNAVTNVGQTIGGTVPCKAGDNVQITTASYASNPTTMMQYSIRAYLFQAGW